MMNTKELLDIDDDLEFVTCIFEELSFVDLSKMDNLREESEALDHLHIFHFAIQCNGFVSLYDQTVQPRSDWLGIEHLMTKIGAFDSCELFQKARKIYYSGDQFPDSSEDFKSVIWLDPDGAEAQEFYEVAEVAENAFYSDLIPKLAIYFRQNWELFSPLMRQGQPFSCNIDPNKLGRPFALDRDSIRQISMQTDPQTSGFPEAKHWVVSKIYHDRRRVLIRPDSSVNVPRWLSDIRRLLPILQSRVPSELLSSVRQSGGIDLGSISGRDAHQISQLLRQSATIMDVSDASYISHFPKLAGGKMMIEDDAEREAFCSRLIELGAIVEDIHD